MSGQAPVRVSVHVGRLRLSLGDGAGHEHRVRPIVTRALHLLQHRLRAEAGAGVPWPSLHVHTLHVPAMRVALQATSDEGVAERVADAMHRALRLARPGEA